MYCLFSFTPFDVQMNGITCVSCAAERVCVCAEQNTIGPAILSTRMHTAVLPSRLCCTRQVDETKRNG